MGLKSVARLAHLFDVLGFPETGEFPLLALEPTRLSASNGFVGREKLALDQMGLDASVDVRNFSDQGLEVAICHLYVFELVPEFGHRQNLLDGLQLRLKGLVVFLQLLHGLFEHCDLQPHQGCLGAAALGEGFVLLLEVGINVPLDREVERVLHLQFFLERGDFFEQLVDLEQVFRVLGA